MKVATPSLNWISLSSTFGHGVSVLASGTSIFWVTLVLGVHGWLQMVVIGIGVPEIIILILLQGWLASRLTPSGPRNMAWNFSIVFMTVLYVGPFAFPVAFPVVEVLALGPRLNVFAEEYAVSVPLRSFTVFNGVSGNLSSERSSETLGASLTDSTCKFGW